MIGQCIVTINSYPYSEDFEMGPGGWVSGGLNNDWARGKPTKPAINTAGSGVNCWITGGLSTSFYNYGERSWVQSPCFDFTNLNHPEISMLIYLESEYRYDGSNLQYSVNGGTSWTNVGAVNEPADCFTANWYNFANITNMTTLATFKNGWSGNHLPTVGNCQGGNGSGGWVLAKHCLPNLARVPQVIFRITFGAGTTCNDFDGFAFDLVKIQDAPLPIADFNYICSTGNTLSFTDATTNCPESWLWIYGDGFIDSTQNTTHNYSSPGTYNVTLIAGNTCAGPDSISKTITIISSNVLSTPESCPGASDGTATVNVNPVGVYNYSWNTIPVQQMSKATGLSAGTYIVSITGASCPVTASVNVVTRAGQTPFLTSNTTPESCTGNGDGTATVIINPPGSYNVSWNTAPPGTTTTITNLNAGNYIVTVTGSGICTPLSLNVNVSLAASTVSVTTSSSHVSCHGAADGTATALVNPGGVYTYSWNTIPVQQTQTATGLMAGTYTVSISGANVCSTTSTILVTQPTAISATISNPVNVQCYGGNNGSTYVVASGGTPGYTYSWSPSISTSATIANLSAGNYFVTVTDSFGCTSSATANIAQPPPLSGTITTVSADCNGANTGSASVTPSGGTSPYTYNWFPTLGSSDTANGLPSGNYFVTVTDSHNCTDTLTFFVNQPTSIVPIVYSTNASCGSNNGSAYVSVTGGTGSYNYLWSPSGTTSSSVNGLATGNYSVRITDQNGCSIADTVTINQSSSFTILASGDTTICISQFAQLSVFPNGGTPAYVVHWSNGVNTDTQSVSPHATTRYSVTMQDANGCNSDTQTVTVTVRPPLAIVASYVQNICVGDKASISALASGGSGGPYSYWWNNGSISGNSANVYPINDSTFTVTVSDGCGTPPARDSVNIIVHPLPIVDFLPHFIQGCRPVLAEFNNRANTSPGSSYMWNFGDQTISTDSNPTHSFKLPGRYEVSLTIVTSYSCLSRFSEPNSVIVFDLPKAGFYQSASNVSIFNPAISFNDNSINAVSWQWDFGDSSASSNQQNPVHVYQDTGSYTIRLIVRSNGGCLDSSYGTLRIDYEFSIYIPNTFTPNGDGVNDFFSPAAKGITDFDMRILDRWGKEIYHSINLNQGWDGSYKGNGNMCQNDVYEYIITVYDFSGKQQRFIGRITLNR